MLLEEVGNEVEKEEADDAVSSIQKTTEPWNFMVVSKLELYK